MIAIKSPIWWIAPLAIMTIILLAFFVFWRVLNIAENNPHAAILDGAQFLKYEMRQQSSKNTGLIDVLPNSQRDDPELPALTADVVASANTPDVAPQIEDKREQK